MFGIGFPELIVILVLGLILLGPERLPQLARTLGQGFRELQRLTHEIKEEIDDDQGHSNSKAGRSHDTTNSRGKL